MESDNKDIGYVEDGFNCVADLYCAETHALATYAQTGKEDWLEIAEMCRRDRSKILYELAPEKLGESYCFMKHISAVSRILQELGNRKLEAKDRDSAKEYFEKSEMYKKLFMILNIENGGKK